MKEGKSRRFAVLEVFLAVDRSRIHLDVAAGITLAALGIFEAMTHRWSTTEPDAS